MLRQRLTGQHQHHQLTAKQVFSHQPRLSRSDILLPLLCAPITLSLRLVLISFSASLVFIFSRLGLIFHEHNDHTPLTGWRMLCQRLMWTCAGRVALLILGFRVRVQGSQVTRDNAPILVSAPHTSWLDMLVSPVCHASVVSRSERSQSCFLPMGTIKHNIGHTIFVDRNSQEHE